MNEKQSTQWTCSQRLNYTATKVTIAIRECIPKIDLNFCTSYASFYEKSIECICNEEGCNDLVVEVEDEDTTTVTSEPSESTSTVTSDTTQHTTTDGTGGSSVLFPLLTTHILMSLGALVAFN